MRKFKSNSSMRKRFKKTGSGKLLRNKQGRRHILTKKTSKKKRELSNPGVVKSSHAKKYSRMMGK